MRKTDTEFGVCCGPFFVFHPKNASSLPLPLFRCPQERSVIGAYVPAEFSLPMKSPLKSLCVRMAVASVFCSGALQAAYPTFTGTKPNGGQRGSELNLTLTGDKLDDFEGIIFNSPGFVMKSVGKVEKNKVECVITIGQEVLPGNHSMRIRTRTGVSHARQFFVGPFPNVDEKEPNNEFDTAQQIGFDQTIEGVVQSEDVDYYKITAKKGQRISLEADGLRLGYTTFDPYIAILDKDRFEKVNSDDTILHRQDGYCSYVAEEDGDYFILMRESSYRGGGTSFYRLHVGSFRRPEVVYPAGGKAGTTAKVRFIEHDGASFEEDVVIPAQVDENYMLYSKSQAAAPSGNPFRVTAFDNALEVEPNDEQAKATPVTLGEPFALNGIIEKAGDVDYFKVTLKKGLKVEVQAFAQLLGSPLDSVVNIYNDKGASLAGNDDGGGRRRLDSKMTVSIPADGDYFVRVTDQLERGGPNFVYRIEMVASQPSLVFASPQYVVNDTHIRQFIAIPKGGRYATLVNISRNNVSGDFKFETPGMPKGAKLLTDVFPKDLPNLPLLFEAAPDAPLGHGLVPIALKSVDPAVKVVGTLRQEFDIVRSGNVIYYTEIQDQLPVAVIEEAPYSLEIVKPTTPLVVQGVSDLKVVAKRKEGFKAPIRVFMMWKPPGVSCLGEQTIPEGGTECVFNLDANGGVPAGKWNFTVMGEADAGNGRIYNASPYCEVTTGPASINAPTMALTAVEQGQEAVMVCKLELLQPFEGEAVAQVLGVPDTIPIDSAKITKDTKEVSFTVRTTDKSPIGKQGNLFVKVDVPVPGGISTHRIALGSILRIDKPRPAPVAPAAAPVVAANAPKEAPKPAAPKPLSRLEQLRQEAMAAKK